jgi:hypothetical protein
MNFTKVINKIVNEELYGSGSKYNIRVSILDDQFKPAFDGDPSAEITVPLLGDEAMWDKFQQIKNILNPPEDDEELNSI